MKFGIPEELLLIFLDTIFQWLPYKMADIPFLKIRAHFLNN